MVYQGESLLLILVKQTQDFAWVCIIMLIIVLIKKQSLSLKLIIEMLSFQHSFVSDLYLTDFVLVSLRKYL